MGISFEFDFKIGLFFLREICLHVLEINIECCAYSHGTFYAKVAVMGPDLFSDQVQSQSFAIYMGMESLV